MIDSIKRTISREWNRMICHKMIFIVIVGIPILVNLLLGVQFSKNQIQNIPMVIYDQDQSSLSRMIVQQFQENEIFNVKYYVDNSMHMQKLMDDSQVRVGMVIPKGFAKEVTALKSPTILMLYDGSHMSIVSAAKSRATEILLTLKTGILIKLIEGKMNLPADMAEKMALNIQFSNRTLYNPTKSFKNFLNPGFGTAIVQSGIALMAAVAIRREEVHGGKIKRAGYLLGKLLFYSVLGWLSLIICILIQVKLFQIPFRGNIWDVALFSLLLSSAVSAFGMLISTWIKNQMLATQINAVLFVPNTVMVGFTWPVLSMPRPYQVLAYFYPFYHYADNIRDMFLKGNRIQYMLKDVQWFVLFTTITFSISLLGIFRLKNIEGLLEEEPEREGDAVVLS